MNIEKIKDLVKIAKVIEESCISCTGSPINDGCKQCGFGNIPKEFKKAIKVVEKELKENKFDKKYVVDDLKDSKYKIILNADIENLTDDDCKKVMNVVEKIKKEDVKYLNKQNKKSIKE